MGYIHLAKEIDLNIVLPVLGSHLHKRLQLAARTGIVNQDIDLAESAYGCIDHLLYFSAIPHIDFHGDALATRSAFTSAAVFSAPAKSMSAATMSHPSCASMNEIALP